MPKIASLLLVVACAGGCHSHAQYLEGDRKLSAAEIEAHIDNAVVAEEAGDDEEARRQWGEAIRGGLREYDALVRGSRCASRLALRREAIDRVRADLAREALAWAEVATAQDERGVRGLFAQALALGLLSESSSLESSVGQILALTTRVIAADERFAHAGGLRIRGLTFLRAPDLWGGDLDRALEDLERAVQLAAGFAENHLAYAEALIEDEDADAARLQLEAAARADRGPRIERWYVELRTRLDELGAAD